MTAHRDTNEEYLRLRGQMLYVHEWKAIIYLATPVYVFIYVLGGFSISFF